ncbi:phosphoserine aminotransferase [Eremomyces bilateralis CBS 781.70]|uniref:phosphoserine transaminase n=1 Tax=Eremomyces bilateralis CBS 781.70 TaxID=1392243 RepID=A0A6G1FYV4_9PEZI|nr:phosphoserine aminotransferase [Eremomyces bilateralis CBS 781.70]KAF1811027.1 phosphoserine aminotransferase [Eremomyces bilateralis CBS 781.70]
MPPRSDVHYFGAGPAPLPTNVLEEASNVLLNYNDRGVGICEISHRSADATAILDNAKAALVTLYNIPTDEYEILFLQGGGSGEFSAVVYHLVSYWVAKRQAIATEELRLAVADGKADTGVDVNKMVIERLKREVHDELKLDYLVTGSWSLKASQEAARLVGAEHVNIAVDSRVANDGKFGKIPSEETWNVVKRKREGGPGSAMVYLCDNETVDGVEFPGFPKSLESYPEDAVDDDAPLVVADMSSNFISRPIDVRKYAVIFGGAQKNVGNAGITIVIVRKSLLPPVAKMASPELLRELGLPVGPIVLDWPTIAKNNSLYNTLPIFDVWVAGRVMAGLVQSHGSKGIAGQGEIATQKAALVYGALDKYPAVYRVVPDQSVRSRMNICFRVGGESAEKEKEFLQGAEQRGLTGLKGHRSVGGIRASNYNAVSMEAVQKLVQYLQDYAQAS